MIVLVKVGCTVGVTVACGVAEGRIVGVAGGTVDVGAFESKVIVGTGVERFTSRVAILFFGSPVPCRSVIICRRISSLTGGTTNVPVPGP